MILGKTIGRMLGASILVVLAVGAWTVSPGPRTAQAAQLGPVDASIPDGDPGSLRDVIENQATNAGGDTVVLQGGATYTLTCDAGGDLDHGSTPLTIEGNGATITIEPTCLERILEQGSAELTLRDVTIRDAVAKGEDGGGISASGDVVLERVRLLNNSAGDAINGGSGGGLQAENVTIVDSILAGNLAQRDGDGGALRAFGDVTVIRSTISDNEAINTGGILAGSTGTVTIVGSTLSGNCAEGGEGALSGDDVVMTNSTVTGNHSQHGGTISASTLQLTYSTVVDNTVSETTDCPNIVTDGGAAVGRSIGPPANIEVGADDGLTVFGSVIALPNGGPNCVTKSAEPLTSTTSYGYNFSDDDTCGLTNTPAGDRQAAGDPRLGPLGSNGGPTATRVPLSGSPLRDVIPGGACRTPPLATEVGTDQRGFTRPQFGRCDIGAVEVEEPSPEPPAPSPLVVTPRFTG